MLSHARTEQVGLGVLTAGNSLAWHEAAGDVSVAWCLTFNWPRSHPLLLYGCNGPNPPGCLGLCNYMNIFQSFTTY